MSRKLCYAAGCGRKPKDPEDDACHQHRSQYAIDLLQEQNRSLELQLEETKLKLEILQLEAKQREEDAPKLSWDDLETKIEDKINNVVISCANNKIKSVAFNTLSPAKPARRLPQIPQEFD